MLDSLGSFNTSLEMRVSSMQVCRLLAKSIRYCRHSSTHTENDPPGRYFSGGWICSSADCLSFSTLINSHSFVL